MTISNDEFKQGESEKKQYKAIEYFLKGDPDIAYTAEEILKNVFRPESSTEPSDIILDVAVLMFITSLLREMISKRKIMVKFISGVPYYKWRK